MNKNKIVSILLLIVVLLLTLIIGLFFSYKSMETEKNIEGYSSPNLKGNTYQNQNEPNQSILNNQLQNIYFFMTLFYTNEANENIYTKLLKQNINWYKNNENWYTIYQNNNLLGNISDININELLNEKHDFYYDSFGNINYNIKNGDNFKNYIKKLYNTFTKHSYNQLTFGTISNDYTGLAPYTELVEMMYISNFVPNSLYNIYIMPFNEIIVNYSGAINSYSDFIAFHQLYASANQMSFSKKYIIDKNGKLLNYINFIQPNSSENPSVQQFMQNIMYIFESPNYTSVLEPSYILFYQALMYFAHTYGFASDYSTYNYSLITTSPTTTTTTTTPAKKTTSPTTLPPSYNYCNGTLYGGYKFNSNSNSNKPCYELIGGVMMAVACEKASSSGYPNEFTPMNITNINNGNIIANNNNGGFQFKTEGNYNITLSFSQYVGGNNGNQNLISIQLIGVNNNNNNKSKFYPAITNLSGTGYSKGNANVPAVNNNIVNFYNKIANSGESYVNMFQYDCTITITNENIINNDLFYFHILCNDGQGCIGTPQLYFGYSYLDIYNNVKNDDVTQRKNIEIPALGYPTFIITSNNE